MVAALHRGEIDASTVIPPTSSRACEADQNIEVVAGQQGGFDEIAINGGAGVGQPHPALLDLDVAPCHLPRRGQGSHHRGPVVRDGRAVGHQSARRPTRNGSPRSPRRVSSLRPGASQPTSRRGRLPRHRRRRYQGDAGRGQPDRPPPWGQHRLPTWRQPSAELFQGWMAEIGIGVELQSYDEGPALRGYRRRATTTASIGAGSRSSTPTRCCRTSPQSETRATTTTPTGPIPSTTELYSGAEGRPRPGEPSGDGPRDADGHPRRRRVHATSTPSPTCRRTAPTRFEGWVRQPAEIGPVMFTNSLPRYVLLRRWVAEAR